MAKKGKRIIVYLKSVETGLKNYSTTIHRDVLQEKKKIVLKKYDKKLKRHVDHEVVKK